MRLLKEGALGFVRVFADGLVVLRDHWPQLVGLFLLGWAGRMGFVWLAVVVSDWSPTVAVLLLPLAPLATLLSLILMLRVTADTLPAFDNLFAAPRRERWRDNLAVATQVLLPFLAVYASQGLLRDDTRLFLYDSTFDEWVNTGLADIDFGRATYAEGWALVAMVVGALALRKVISLTGVAKKAVAWAFAATYLEALWMVTFAQSLKSMIESLTTWVTSRAIVAQVLDWWNALLASLPQIVAPIEAVLGAIGGVLEQAGNLVVVPVAWLAIGAAVYGQKLKDGEPIATHEDVTQRLAKVPNPVRRVVAQTVEPVTTPIKEAATAIGRVAAAGVVPMVLFCIVFVVASQMKVLVAAGFRVVVGPQEPWLLYSLEPYSILLQRLVYFTLALALLAAAVNTVVLAQRNSAGEAPAEVQDGMASTA